MSRSVLSAEELRVKGFPWCEHEFKELSRDGLVSKMLCRKHNNDLSPLDEEIQRVQKSVARLRETLEGTSAPSSTREVHVDGFLFARWLSKTYCNVLAASGRQVGSEWVNFAFGKKSGRTVRLYLYAMKGVGMRPDTDHLIGFADSESNDGLAIVEFLVFGVPWIMMNFELPRDQLITLQRFPSPIDKTNLMESPKVLQAVIGKSAFRLSFRWPPARR